MEVSSSILHRSVLRVGEGRIVCVCVCVFMARCSSEASGFGNVCAGVVRSIDVDSEHSGSPFAGAHSDSICTLHRHAG